MVVSGYLFDVEMDSWVENYGGNGFILDHNHRILFLLLLNSF